ncbi:MAG: PEP-CTERM sorting domain-containing protein [Burkholderiaceae bacterium]|nr:PEP-CTERM sorting domain-containing protein [Burkholderiaceae bacterium]MBT9502292.1 PEP-CTERM sorting domain-containing protein [Burkholderiaceae bacterium]
MTKKSVVTSLAMAALAAAIPAHAAISVGSAAFTYSQSFDSLATSGAANAWVNDSTLAGWSLFNKTPAAITAYAAGDGSSNTGAFYSFGSSGTAERALGGTASGGAYFGSPAAGTLAGWIAVALTNDTGSALNSFTIGYNGEQWRNGGNTSAQTMVMEYGFGATFAGVGAGWTPAGAGFNFTSTVNTATAAAVNGNTAGLVGGLGGTVTTNWANGATLWVRWIENNDAGFDHGLAIDDVRLSVTAVPEPESYALMLAGLAGLALVARRRKS